MSKDGEDFCFYSTVGNGDDRIFPIMPFPTVRHVVAETFDSASDQMVGPQAEVPACCLPHQTDARALVCPGRSIEVEGARGKAGTHVLSQPATKNEAAQPSVEPWRGVVRWGALLLIGGIGMAYLLD